MDIFFSDPSEVPLPPEEVRISQLRAEPWPDGQRVRVYLEVDPTQKRPSADLTILNPQGEAISTVSIVESMTRKMEVVMHLRSEPTPGEYSLHATLYFDPMPPPDAGSEPSPLAEPLVVDTAQTPFQFDLPT